MVVKARANLKVSKVKSKEHLLYNYKHARYYISLSFKIGDIKQNFKYIQGQDIKYFIA